MDWGPVVRFVHQHFLPLPSSWGRIQRHFPQVWALTIQFSGQLIPGGTGRHTKESYSIALHITVHWRSAQPSLVCICSFWALFQDPLRFCAHARALHSWWVDLVWNIARQAQMYCLMPFKFSRGTLWMQTSQQAQVSLPYHLLIRGGRAQALPPLL